jgi:epoxyqueuosine reductase
LTPGAIRALTETDERRIKRKGLSLGFAAVGIARATSLGTEAERLHEWLDRGYHASMRWMASRAEERVDPREVLRGARSIISVAVNYYTPEEHAGEPGAGKVSRYAWGDDYHDILAEQLRTLWSWIQGEFPGVEGTWYVDTGPVMEKAWAERAGIGWIGKHANLITRSHGSWVFLGEIITTLDLEPDSPAVDHCGTCTLCIEACPTQAIVQPYVVESQRCLSYLTIEHRGPIEGDVRDHFEGWVFGCDICQDVCPWNKKFATPTDDDRFAPREGNLEPDLYEWGQMDSAEFRRRFSGSPIKRAKHEGLRRNIQILTGDQEPPSL